MFFVLFIVKENYIYKTYIYCKHVIYNILTIYKMFVSLCVIVCSSSSIKKTNSFISECIYVNQDFLIQSISNDNVLFYYLKSFSVS